ncbi:MAG: hypothetical protein ACOYVD_02260 [Bacillota bacterium]
MSFNYEEEWRNINCLVPVYDQQGGNFTEIWLNGGEKVIIPNKTNTVLKNLAKVFAVDLSQLKKKYGVLVGRKASSPLPLHPDLILIPLKVREPYAKDEGARAYIIRNKLKKAYANEVSGCSLLFTDGSILSCLQNVTSVNLAVAHGEIIYRECQINNQWDTIRERDEMYRVLAAVLSTLSKERVNN